MKICSLQSNFSPLPEKQDVDILLTTPAMRFQLSKQEVKKNIAVELANMVGKGSTDYQWEVHVWS